MTMVLCKDCKWWEAPSLEVIEQMKMEPPIVGRVCYWVRFWGACELTKAGYFENSEKHPESLAFSYDGDDQGSLTTSPDFGCVQGETGEELHEEVTL